MRFLGAKVVLTPPPAGGTGMVAKAVELAETHGWFLTRQFENEANADIHSRTTAREIVADFAGERLDYWVTGFGTGGTLKGVARVLEKERPETQIVLCGARGCATGVERHAARAEHGRVACGPAPCLEATSDSGVESGLHPEAGRGRHRGRPGPPRRSP